MPFWLGDMESESVIGQLRGGFPGQGGAEALPRKPSNRENGSEFDWQKFRAGRAYGLLTGLPLIYWFGYVDGVRLRPYLATYARAVLAEPANLLADLRFFSLFASVAFNLLTVYFVVTRTNPVRRSSGWLPRAIGFAGTFFGISLQYLKPATLSIGWQSLALSLIVISCSTSIFVLSKLGRSFSIMPEARTFVSDGPYAIARHPLYAAEFVGIVGTSILFAQPWSAMIALGIMLLLVARSHFEEQVLSEAYPQYALYRARVKRFGLV